jgi:ribosomal protein S18 acetylase RimI-like enzyme
VDGSQRNKGVGQGLIDAAEWTAKKMGRKRMTLEVKEDREVTLLFYGKLGYVPVGRLMDYYGKGVHGLRMMKHI